MLGNSTYKIVLNESTDEYVLFMKYYRQWTGEFGIAGFDP